MRLFAKVIGSPEIKTTDKAHALLVDEARLWLRSGLSWADWSDLDDVERQAVLAAREQILAEDIAMRALAAQDLTLAGKAAGLLSRLFNVAGGAMSLAQAFHEALVRPRPRAPQPPPAAPATAPAATAPPASPAPAPGPEETKPCP